MLIREYKLHSIKIEGKYQTTRETLHTSKDTDAKLPDRSNIVQDYAICYLQNKELEYLSKKYNIKVEYLIDNYSLKFNLVDNSLVYLKLDCISHVNQDQCPAQDRFSVNLKLNIQLFNNYFNKLNNKTKTITLEYTKNISEVDTITLIPLETIRRKYLIPSNGLIKQMLRGTIINSAFLNIAVKLRDGLLKAAKVQNSFSLCSDKADVGRIGNLTKINILYNLEPNLLPSLAKKFKLNFKVINLIIEGADGVWKTHLLYQLEKYFNLPQVKINLYNISKNGDNLNSLKSLFNAGVKQQSNLLVLDNLEVLFPPGCDSKLVSTYMDLMYSLCTYNNKHVIIGTTTNIHKVDKTTLNTFLINFKIVPDKLNNTAGCFNQYPELEQVASRYKFSNETRIIESINWSDIGGLENVKIALKEYMACIYANPDTLKSLNIVPTKGILLYGPPGGGKTLLAKAVATEYSAKFIPLSIPSLMQHEIGESEKTLAQIFDKAKLFGPSVIFIDEIECAFGTRNSEGYSMNGLISQLILELDDLKYSPGVIVLAATNYPSSIDQSLLRPGRFDKLIHIPPPDMEERKAILTTSFKRIIISDDVDLQSIAYKTEHFSGADLRTLVDRATLYAYQRAKITRLREQSVKVRLENEDFEEALKVVEPTRLNPGHQHL